MAARNFVLFGLVLSLLLGCGPSRADLAADKLLKIEQLRQQIADLESEIASKDAKVDEAKKLQQSMERFNRSEPGEDPLPGRPNAAYIDLVIQTEAEADAAKTAIKRKLTAAKAELSALVN